MSCELWGRAATKNDRSRVRNITIAIQHHSMNFRANASLSTQAQHPHIIIAPARSHSRRELQSECLLPQSCEKHQTIQHHSELQSECLPLHPSPASPKPSIPLFARPGRTVVASCIMHWIKKIAVVRKPVV